MASLNSDYSIERLAWSCSQLTRIVLRRIGLMGVVLIAMAVVLCALLVFLSRQTRQIEALRIPQVITNSREAPELTGALGMANDLNDFQHYLLDYADIPVTLRDLIVLAQANYLVLSRGEYQTEVDQRGQFLRYQMTLPVRGDAQAVERFMLAALAQHKTMALKSVQFKREERSARELEARVQWVLLTRLPRDAGVDP